MRFSVSIAFFALEPEEQVKLCLESKTRAVSLALYYYEDKAAYLKKAAALFKENGIEIAALHGT
ncbi:MAG: hypothetical protein WCK36_01685, partial [Candidatus Firestonebacteria bacterium]